MLRSLGKSVWSFLAEPDLHAPVTQRLQSEILTRGKCRPVPEGRPCAAVFTAAVLRSQSLAAASVPQQQEHGDVAGGVFTGQKITGQREGRKYATTLTATAQQAADPESTRYATPLTGSRALDTPVGPVPLAGAPAGRSRRESSVMKMSSIVIGFERHRYTHLSKLIEWELKIGISLPAHFDSKKQTKNCRYILNSS